MRQTILEPCFHELLLMANWQNSQTLWFYQERIRVRSVQLPIYTIELSKTKLRRIASFKNFHIRKFLDSRTTILTSRTAKTADSVEDTPRRRRQAEVPLEYESTKRHRKSWDYYGSSSSCPGKPKTKERRLANKNIKRVYEELDDFDELLQDVLNVCSSATNGYTLSCKRFLPRPRASDSAIVYEYITNVCTCVDKRHDVAKRRRSLVFDKSQLNVP